MANNVDSVLLTSAQVGTGIHIVTATVVDTTALTRAPDHFSTHSYVVQWTINGVTSVVNAQMYAAKLKIYPNPFSNEMYVAYELTKRADVAIEFLNLQGQLLKRIERKKELPGKYQFTVDI